MLEHAHVEVAQRRRILRVKSQVLPVLEAPAGQEDRQVPDGMAAAVAEVTAQEYRGPLEQAGAFLLRLLQLGEQVAQRLQRFDLDNLELIELAGVLPVVRQ